MPADQLGEVIVDRSAARRAERPRSRRTMNGVVFAALGLILLFAVIGLVSAGVFVAGKVSSAPAKATATAHSGTTGKQVAQARVARRNLVRARARATAIVAAARAASHSIVTGATNRARQQSAAILA